MWCVFVNMCRVNYSTQSGSNVHICNNACGHELWCIWVFWLRVWKLPDVLTLPYGQMNMCSVSCRQNCDRSMLKVRSHMCPSHVRSILPYLACVNPSFNATGRTWQNSFHHLKCSMFSVGVGSVVKCTGIPFSVWARLWDVCLHEQHYGMYIY